MREWDFRRMVQGTALVATMAFMGAATPRAVTAQTPDPNSPATTPQTGIVDDDDDGMDWGWVGLLGLAGLLGLRRRDDHVDRTDSTRRT